LAIDATGKTTPFCRRPERIERREADGIHHRHQQSRWIIFSVDDLDAKMPPLAGQNQAAVWSLALRRTYWRCKLDG
jgi:hypothetical protein